MRDQEIIGLWEAYQQVHAQPQEEVESVDEGVRPGEVETPLDMKKYRERRRSLAGREASADAEERGHVDKFTGKPYGTKEAASRRKDIHTPAKKPSRDAARDAAGGETGHGGPLRAKKVRKAKAMGELGEGVDLFDYLLEYLVAEGYADTNKEALAIMANMSEEWKQSIIEGVGGYDDPILGPDTPGGKLVRSGIGAVKKVVTGVVKGVGSEFAKPAPQQPLRPLTQKEKESYKTIK